MQWCLFLGGRSVPHALDEHAGDLGGDDVVCYAVGDLGGGEVRGEEVEEVVIYAVEIFSVLKGVVEAFSCNLRELTASRETGRGEGVARTSIDRPVRGGGFITRGIKRRAIVEKPLVVAVPAVRLFGKCVGCIGCSFMMTVDAGSVSCDLSWRRIPKDIHTLPRRLAQTHLPLSYTLPFVHAACCTSCTFHKAHQPVIANR